MKKITALFVVLFLYAIPLSSELVEWIGYGGPAIFGAPPREEDAHGVFFKQVQYRLKKRGFDIMVPEGSYGRGDVMVFINCPSMDFFTFHRLLKNPCKKILITWEPPTVNVPNHDPTYHKIFDRIITWNTNLIDGKRYLQYWYPVASPYLSDLPTFRERRLVCMVSADKQSNHPKELYSERRRVIDFYEARRDLSFHLYGNGWGSHHLRNFISAPRNKMEVMKCYRFSYAFENYLNNEGYITEKIFDCFQTGTVPIYLGATNIADFIPANCFIDARNFSSYKQLHNYIETMDESRWLEYQVNIQRFLSSREATLFSSTTLADAIEEAIFN